MNKLVVYMKGFYCYYID